MASRVRDSRETEMLDCMWLLLGLGCCLAQAGQAAGRPGDLQAAGAAGGVVAAGECALDSQGSLVTNAEK